MSHENINKYTGASIFDSATFHCSSHSFVIKCCTGSVRNVTCCFITVHYYYSKGLKNVRVHHFCKVMVASSKAMKHISQSKPLVSLEIMGQNLAIFNAILCRCPSVIVDIKFLVNYITEECTFLPLCHKENNVVGAQEKGCLDVFSFVFCSCLSYGVVFVFWLPAGQYLSAVLYCSCL